MPSDSTHIVKSGAIEGVIKRLDHSPSNNLSDEDYRGTVKAGWDGQWGNWDDLGPDDPTPGGWGDVGD